MYFKLHVAVCITNCSYQLDFICEVFKYCSIFTSLGGFSAFFNVSLYCFLGLFNAGDKVLIALDIFLEWQELFNKGVPLSMLTECKLNSLLLTVPKVCAS